MDVQNDRKFRLYALHCCGEKITSNAGNDVLAPDAAICAITIAAILELSGSIVGKHNVLFMVVADDARVWIGQLAAARQFQQQKSADTLECYPAAINDAAAVTNGSPRRAIEVVPEFFDRRMQRTPFTLELINLFVGEALGLKFPPGIFAAHIAGGEIASFADSALRRFLGIRAVRHPEDLARSDAVRLIARITCCVEAAILINFPLLAGDPGQDSRFDGAEIGADQHIAGRRYDHRPRTVANDGKRVLVQFA